MRRGTEADLAAFRVWLEENDLMPDTIDIYIGHVKAALAVGIIEMLRDDARAPKTRKLIQASCRRWALFTEDTKLQKAMGKIRLPAARRKKPKVPIERQQLFDLIDELERAADMTPVMKGVIGTMACRGLRVGDVLRLQRTEIEEALASGVLGFEAKGRRRLEFKILLTYKAALKRLVAAGAGTEWERVDELVSPKSEKSARKAAAKAVSRALHRLGIRAGILNLHPHRLRRTYAVEYLRQMPGDPEAIMKLQQHMQWANMTTAMEYIDHQRGAELDEPAGKIFDRDR